MDRCTIWRGFFSTCHVSPTFRSGSFFSFKCLRWLGPWHNSLEFTALGALKGTNLRGQTQPKRRFSQIFADFCRFSPSPGKQSIWETQIFAENRRFSQETAQIGVCPLRFVPLSAALFTALGMEIQGLRQFQAIFSDFQVTLGTAAWTSGSLSA